MIHKITFTGFLSLCLAFSAPLFAEIKIVNGNGSTIEDLIREQALVTIILNGNIRDVNLKLKRFHDNTIGIETSDGQPSAYLVSGIKEIRVQERRINKSKRSRVKGGALDTDDKVFLNRVSERTFALFQSLQGKQELKMKAAAIMAAAGNEDAEFYLASLANGNDTPIALEASLHLFTIGAKIDPNILQDGFISGNRKTRALTARLAGLTQCKPCLKDVRDMLSDPAPDIFPDAVLAAARLGDRSNIPYIMKGLSSLSYVKSEAAVNALILLKSDELVAMMQEELKKKQGMEWFRIVRILSASEVPGADDILREKCLKPTSYNRIAAILLTEKSDWEGGLWLREYLDKAVNPNFEHLMYEANIAITLYGSGHIQAKTILQKLARLKPSEVYVKGHTGDEEYNKGIIREVQIEVCDAIGRLGDRSLLSMLTTMLTNDDPEVALAAGQAAMMIANESYRVNVNELNTDHISKLVFYTDLNER